jgi:hypothetical protein
VPWLSVKGADGSALFAISYENPRSVAIKADYIKDVLGKRMTLANWRSRWGSKTSLG